MLHIIQLTSLHDSNFIIIIIVVIFIVIIIIITIIIIIIIIGQLLNFGLLHITQIHWLFYPSF